MEKTIKNCTLEELNVVVKEAHQPSFRKKQLLEWIYKHGISSYEQASNLPYSLVSFLEEKYPLTTTEIYEKQVSRDGTSKYLFELHDGNLVEAVAIPSTTGKQRLTVCFSTQVGCPMACAFCATGHEGFTRNLGMGEIIDQVRIIGDDQGVRVSNLVAMGQGEPFLNTRATLDALKLLNDEKFFNIGARHITVSTCGIVPGIDDFANDPHQYTLAISLHSAIQTTRDWLMPQVAKYPLDNLQQHLFTYIEKTNRRVTFEYLLIKDINDSEEHLEALIEYCRPLLCHVNLLPMNAVEGSAFQPSRTSTTKHWSDTLQASGIETSLRHSRGADISGACGQLKNARQR